jgi:hypothetical protein
MYEGGGVRTHPYGWDLPFPFPLHYDSKFAAAADLSLVPRRLRTTLS